MMREKRLIDANELKDSFGFFRKMWSATEICGIIDAMPTADVTVQKWIPVSERLPDLIPCDAGTAYSEAVNVLTSGRKVLTAIWDGFDWTTDAEFWDAEDEVITHWTPVLLPLPEPPKECE